MLPAMVNSDNKNISIDDMVSYIIECIQIIGKCHIVGLCQGAWASALALTQLENPVHTYINANGPIDTHTDSSNEIYQWCQLIPSIFYDIMVTLSGGVQLGMNQLIGFYGLS